MVRVSPSLPTVEDAMFRYSPFLVQSVLGRRERESKGRVIPAGLWREIKFCGLSFKATW